MKKQTDLIQQLVNNQQQAGQQHLLQPYLNWGGGKYSMYGPQYQQIPLPVPQHVPLSAANVPLAGANITCTTTQHMPLPAANILLPGAQQASLPDKHCVTFAPAHNVSLGDTQQVPLAVPQHAAFWHDPHNVPFNGSLDQQLPLAGMCMDEHQPALAGVQYVPRINAQNVPLPPALRFQFPAYPFVTPAFVTESGGQHASVPQKSVVHIHSSNSKSLPARRDHNI